MRFALVVLMLLAGCGGGATKEPPPTKIEEVVGSWSASDLFLTVNADGTCSSSYTVKQQNGQMTDWRATPSLKQQGQGYVVPIVLNETNSDSFIIDVSDDGKSLTLTQQDGPKKFTLTKDAK